MSRYDDSPKNIGAVSHVFSFHLMLGRSAAYDDCLPVRFVEQHGLRNRGKSSVVRVPLFVVLSSSALVGNLRDGVALYFLSSPSCSSCILRGQMNDKVLGKSSTLALEVGFPPEVELTVVILYDMRNGDLLMAWMCVLCLG